jgi:transposase
MINMREEKGRAIAQNKAITKVEGGYLVDSQNSNKKYFVDEHLDSCTCPDCLTRKVRCKHAFAVQYYLQKVTIKKGVTKVEATRITYPQAWSAYNKSQETEKTRFMELLSDLVQTTKKEEYVFGRPKTSDQDMLFSSALKVYTQFSLRRFMSDLNEAKEKGLVEKKPCFASVGHYMQKESLAPLLKELIQKSASVLKSVEGNFAIDSTGFRTTKFNDYCKDKHDTKRKHEFLKLHAVVGTKTNIICACNVTESEGLGTGDTSHFQPLVQEVSDSGFTLGEVSADKAYSAIANTNLVHELGGTAYIPYRKHTAGTCRSGNKGKLWRKMFHYFQLNQEEFLEHYHARSNVESTFGALKMKFNDCLKSKTRTAQINELLLKVLCFNIVQVIHETNELGIKLDL